METTIGKWGNSWAIRVPAAIAKQLKLHEAAQVELALDDNRLLVEFPRQEKAVLNDIIASFEAIGSDEEIQWGSPRGQEEW